MRNLAKYLAISILAVVSVADAGAAAAAKRAPIKVTVNLTSHRFTPGPIYLAGGVPVRLTLANPSGESHEFRAPEFFYWSSLRGKVPGGVVKLQSGERKTFVLTPRRGTYKLRCGRFGHSFLGMNTTIIVQ